VIRSIAAAILTFALAACGDLLVDSFEYGTVHVAATTRSGAPAPAVHLILYSGTRHLGFAETGPNGRARFDFVPEGSLGVSASPAWFYGVEDPPTPYYVEFGMLEGEARTIEFSFIGPGALSVEAVLASGEPAMGHEVEVYDLHGSFAREVVTGPEALLFAPLQPGAAYGVRVHGTQACPLSPAGFVESGGHIAGEETVTPVRVVAHPC